MKVLIRKFLNEPAVCLSVLGAVALTVVKLASGDPFGQDDLLEIFALLGVGAGTRQLVTPEYGE